jgi:UDP-N-acetylmuramoyl-tripeptide--D-alanyl-D-alanine ligase
VHFRAFDVATATGGTLFGPDTLLTGVSFDSRSIEPGQLFVALVAERDGHDFIPAALVSGAGAYLTEQAPGSGTAIVVADTGAALLRLGSWSRNSFDGPVVGITGSVGKTSTKDLARAALAAGKRVAANVRSFNNEQGLPVTILNAPDDTEVLVLEMGMRGFGEITRLCDVGRPTIGVVTRVAAAHTELVGGIDGVRRAKGELIQALPADGVAILNADDPNVAGMAALTTGRVITFGRGDSDVRVHGLRLDDQARARFHIESPWGAADVALGVSGEHMALNAAAALAVAGTCGVDFGAAAAALAGATLSPSRMEFGRNPNGATVINDAYNANPTSMRAAIETLAALPVTGRRVAILGMMAELADPASDHREIAALLERRGIELVAVRTDLYGGIPCDDPVALGRSLTGDDAALVKGSLVSRMQEVARLIMG